ncbi:MAG: RusA family crossover junction endodeoxyribonuclease [Bacteroidetes bacterium]|nr:RusA family crossover junction endodeoxyribonuclease [Bacteroidota bacterium]
MKLAFDIKPLSINKAYTGRRFKTEEYKQYTKDIGYLLLTQKKKIKKFNGLLLVKCNWYLKNWKSDDVDNPTKPLLDILTKMNIINDDRFIMELSLKKIPSSKDFIEIEIKPYAEVNT